MVKYVSSTPSRMAKLENVVASLLLAGYVASAPVALYLRAQNFGTVIMRQGVHLDTEGSRLNHDDVAIEFDRHTHQLTGARTMGICSVDLDAPVNGSYASGVERCWWPRRGMTKMVVTPAIRPTIFSAVNAYASQ
jgi:hypothetical protein